MFWALSLCQMLRQKPCCPNISFEILYVNGQFTLSTQLIKANLSFYTHPPMQCHSFLENYPSLLICSQGSFFNKMDNLTSFHFKPKRLVCTYPPPLSKLWRNLYTEQFTDMNILLHCYKMCYFDLYTSLEQYWTKMIASFLLFILRSLIVSKNHTRQGTSIMRLEFMHALNFLCQLPKLDVTIFTGSC